MSEALAQPKPTEAPKDESLPKVEGVESHEPKTDDEKAEVTDAAADLKEAAETQTAEQVLEEHANADDAQEKSDRQIKREQQQALLEWLQGQDKKMILTSIFLGNVFLGLKGDTTLMLIKMYGDMQRNKKEST